MCARLCVCVCVRVCVCVCVCVCVFLGDASLFKHFASLFKGF